MSKLEAPVVWRENGNRSSLFAWEAESHIWGHLTTVA